MLLVTCMYYSYIILCACAVIRVPRVVLCPLSYLLRVTSSVRNPSGDTCTISIAYKTSNARVTCRLGLHLGCTQKFQHILYHFRGDKCNCA